MTDRTNVLLLMTDQHRVDTLGCYGNNVCQTPAVDALAESGTRFDNAFTPTAICTPARATLLTGQLPFRHALLANYERNVGYREELDDHHVPFTRDLRAAGYQLGHVGKWHVGKRRGPDAAGFEGEHYPGWGNPVQHPDYLRYLESKGLPGFRLRTEVRGTFPNGEPGNLLGGVLDQPVEATFEYFLAERAIERLRRYGGDFTAGGRPFFLGCHWFGPHLPYCIPEKYYDRYDPARVELPASMDETFSNKPRVQAHYSAHWTFDSFSADEWRKLIAVYWGYVSLIDEQVGRILGALDELGLRDNTTVVFTADHGEFTGSHRLHDKGPAMYDDIYRIPLVVRVPGAPAGRVDDAFVSLTDLTPTFLDLAGLDPAVGNAEGAPVEAAAVAGDPAAGNAEGDDAVGVVAPTRFDGRSLVPLLRGERPTDWPDHVTAEFHGHHFPYPQRMLRTKRYKLVVNPPDENELYDLQADPDELHNRYHDPRLVDVRRDLLRRLYEILRDRGDNFYHWMTSMFEVGAKTYDAALSHVDNEHWGRT